MKITSKQHAHKVITYVSKVFIALGSLQIIIYYLMLNLSNESRGIGMGIGFAIVFLAGSLLEFKKATLAHLLILFPVIDLAMSIFSFLNGLSIQNVGLPILSISMIVAGLQAVSACEYLKR